MHGVVSRIDILQQFAIALSSRFSVFFNGRTTFCLKFQDGFKRNQAPFPSRITSHPNILAVGVKF